MVKFLYLFSLHSRQNNSKLPFKFQKTKQIYKESIMTGDEIKKLIADEILSSEIKKALAPAPKSRWARIFSFFNTQMGMWLLGTILLGGFTYGWNYYLNQRRDAEQEKKNIEVEKQRRADKSTADIRDDSEFLAKIMPSSWDDSKTKCRAAQLMKFRHPECPGETESIPCKWLADFTNEVEFKDFSIASCKLFVIAKADDSASKISTPPTMESVNTSQPIVVNPPSEEAKKIVQNLPKRVYIQIYNESQRDLAKKIQNKLRSSGFLVPGIENVGDDTGNKADQIQRSIVRFYDNADKDKASEVQAIVGGDVIAQPATIKGTVNVGTIELWLKP